jgi:thioredoxin reductase
VASGAGGANDAIRASGVMPNALAQAVAAEKASIAAVFGAGNRCPHLLSPLRIRNKVLKNRIMHTVSPTYLMQGPENFPTEMYRNHMSNIAKNAAIVALSTHYGVYPKTYTKGLVGPSQSFSDDSWQDIPPVFNYVNEMIDDIRYQGAMILFTGNTGGSPTGLAPGGGAPGGAGGALGSGGGPGGPGAPGGSGGGAVSSASPTVMGSGWPGGSNGPGGGRRGASGGPGGGVAAGGQAGPGGGPGGGGPGGGPGGPGRVVKTDDEILADAIEYEKNGYDVYQLQSTSLELAKKIREKTNLILMGALRGGGGPIPDASSAVRNQPTEDELKQAVEQAKKLEGVVDIVWIRIDEHPNAWIQDEDRPKSLAYAEAIKKAGINIITCPTGGFHNPIQNEEFIASGKTDMVGMTTPLFADAELVRKLMEGRADDIIPCVGCENCHGTSMSFGPWYSTCTVNPTWGMPPYQIKGITTPKVSKKVAVIGGGPGGMKAALIAAERGHKVTLYEKSDALGGQQKITDYSQCKWDFKRFKDYLAYQVHKQGIEVLLSTKATPEMIKSKGYDTVLVSIGSAIVFSDWESKGIQNVFNIMDVYTNKKALGKNVVVIGTGKYGAEAAISMLKDGHKVTMLSPTKELCDLKDIGPHNMANQASVLNNHPNFSYVLETKVKDINGGKVTYTDSTGKENSIPADSIVIWSGTKPRLDEAAGFIGAADQVLFLGDCTDKGGTVQKTMRSAFFVASQV